MPVGSTLMETIAQNCCFRFNHGGMKEGVLSIYKVISDGINMGMQGDVDLLNEKLSVMRKISETIDMAESIDEFIFRHSDDSRIAELGKLQIAYAIAAAEERSILRVEAFDAGAGFKVANGTWISTFAKALFNGVKASEARQIGSNITIICFNYDRCIEHYLETAIIHAYPAVGREEARKIVDAMNIIHPYGSLGPLSKIPYGDTENLSEMAENIQTWSETVRDPQLVERMHHAISRASQVVFLGFAFAKQNMDLLNAHVSDWTIDPIKSYSTGYGLHQEADQVYRANITQLYRPNLGADEPEHVRIQWGAKCKEFIETNRYNLVQ